MQQKINPQLENEQQKQSYIFQSYKLNHLKNKPFWISSTANKNKNYHKYFKKQYHNMIQSMRIEQPSTNLQSNLDQDQEKKSQYFESILSDNQNYDEDFQSYQQNQNNQDKKYKIIEKLPIFQHKSEAIKKVCRSSKCVKQLEFNTPRLQNLFLNKSRIQTSKKKSITKKNCKTEGISQSTSMKQFLMHQNTLYLRKQNEKLIRNIQQFRKNIPVLLKNQKEEQQLKLQLQEIKFKADKATSTKYQFKIHSSSDLVKQKSRKILTSLRKLNTPQKIIKTKSIINNIFYIQTLSDYEKARQRLLNGMRINLLRQNQIQKLQQRIKMYKKVIQKLDKISKIGKKSQLERRKIFLQWDAEKRKNDIDLLIIEGELQNRVIKDEINQINHQISQKIQQSNRLSLEIESNKKIISPNKKEQKQKQIKNQKVFNFSLQKIMPSIKQTIEDEKEIILIKNQNKYEYKYKQNTNFINLQKNIKKVDQNEHKIKSKGPETSIRRIKQEVTQSPKLNIRIKKTQFLDSTLTDDMQQVYI